MSIVDFADLFFFKINAPTSALFSFFYFTILKVGIL
jgi:hypothetical protein